MVICSISWFLYGACFRTYPSLVTAYMLGQILSQVISCAKEKAYVCYVMN